MTFSDKYTREDLWALRQQQLKNYEERLHSEELLSIAHAQAHTDQPSHTLDEIILKTTENLALQEQLLKTHQQEYTDALLGLRSDFNHNELHVTVPSKSVDVAQYIIAIRYQSALFLDEEPYFLKQFKEQEIKYNHDKLVDEVISDVVKRKVNQIVDDLYEYIDLNHDVVSRVIAAACVSVNTDEPAKRFIQYERMPEFRRVIAQMYQQQGRTLPDVDFDMELEEDEQVDIDLPADIIKEIQAPSLENRTGRQGFTKRIAGFFRRSLK